jgi:hypothetical protein
MEKAKGGNPNSSRDTRGSPSTLSDLGITYDQSSNWQRLAWAYRRTNSRSALADEKERAKDAPQGSGARLEV